MAADHCPGRKARLSRDFGFAGLVGLLGGLIGLGGAEFRLPYLVGVLRFTPRQAVPFNLAISLATVVAALPARTASVPLAEAAPFLTAAASLAAGAVLAAWFGAGWLTRFSDRRLARLILVVLVALGVMLIAGGLAGDDLPALVPDHIAWRVAVGFALGVAIGLVSSLLGVAGGELIIPSLLFGFGVPVKLAGSLSLLISLPTVTAGLLRYHRAGMLKHWRHHADILAAMIAGAVAGAILGGLLVGLVPAAALKIGLGVVLIWSAFRTFRHLPGTAAAQLADAGAAATRKRQGQEA